MSEYVHGQMAAQQNSQIGIGWPNGYCSHPHPPENAETHARQRLAELEREIPSLTHKLAEMATEKKRIERMLAALDTTETPKTP